MTHTDQAAQRFVEHNTHGCAGPSFGPYLVGLDVGEPEGDKTVISAPQKAYKDNEPGGCLRRSVTAGPDGYTARISVEARTGGAGTYRSASWFLDVPSRPGDFMQTFSGRKFWPLDPRSDEVHIEDIAHALSMQCRYGGHCTQFYSVAEHSVLMARTFANRDLALWALLHDAAEAYVADVPRPLKRFLPGYKEAENKVMAAICDRFGLPHEMPERVKYADERIIADEMQQNMHEVDPNYTNPLGVTLQFWDPERACEEFLLEFWNLMDMRWEYSV